MFRVLDEKGWINSNCIYLIYIRITIWVGDRDLK